MRIAQIAPLTEAVPPKLYGGTERVISWLTEALVDLGHDVTLFASGDSVTRAKLEAGWPRALRLDGAVRDANALHMAMLETVAQRASEFDILHFHLDYYPFSLFSRLGKPFVTTLHGRLDLPEHRPVFERFPKAPIVSISHSQRRLLPSAPWMGTVHHGLPEALLHRTDLTPSYLAFLGRISPEKGLQHAIRVAVKCGIPLKIAAKVDRVDTDYFNEEIRPLLDQPGIEFIGEISDAEKSEFLGGALGLLTLIDWPEPFGLVMIEAMACGTPVIAFGQGAVPEVIDDGITGFIVEDEDQAVAAVAKLPSLPRDGVRKHFEKRFTSTRMAEDYLHIYRKLIGDAPVRPRFQNVLNRWSRRTNGEAVQLLRPERQVAAINGSD
jgi:glycosyltransferase involved in cell wall biosynthesis